jgi:hypothetical protein
MESSSVYELLDPGTQENKITAPSYPTEFISYMEILFLARTMLQCTVSVWILPNMDSPSVY